MIDSMIHAAFLFFSSYKILTGNRLIKNIIWRLNTGTNEAQCACNTRTFPDLYITFDTPKSSWPVSLISSKILYLTANEGPVRIQYKLLVPIYVFPEMKQLFPKQNYNVLSPSSSCTHISVRDLYISRIGLPILLHGNMWTDPGNI